MITRDRVKVSSHREAIADGLIYELLLLQIVPKVLSPMLGEGIQVHNMPTI